MLQTQTVDCCQDLEGRRRAICRGETDLPAATVTAYRARWGCNGKTHGLCQGDCPGTELKALLAQLGIKPKSACKCVAKAKIMDQLGAAAIRADKATWIAYLTEAYNTTGWVMKATAAIQAFRHGLPKTIEGLLDEALRRAEEKAAQSI